VLEAGVLLLHQNSIFLFACFHCTSDLLAGPGTLQYSVFPARQPAEWQLVLRLLLCAEPFAVAAPAAVAKYGIVVLC
jgi:hypothetical protein